MKNKISGACGERRRVKSRRFACAALAASMAWSTGATAGIPVLDIPNTVQSIISAMQDVVMSANDAAEYAEQARRWNEQLQQFQQQLVRVQAQLRTVDLPAMQALVPVAENYMVKESCGGEARGFQQVWTLVDIKDDNSVRAQQQQICVNIRVMKNKKYNDSVRYLTHSIPGIKKMLGDIYATRARNNDQGTLQGVDSESLRTANDIEAAGMEWQGRMMAYDAYIQTMEENQRILANEALKGSRGNRLMRTVVQTTAMKLALEG